MRTAPNLPHSSTESNETAPAFTLRGDLSEEAAKTATRGLLDALMEIGRQRQQILLKMKAAVEKGDRDAVFLHAKELVGLCEPGPEGESREIEETAPTSGGKARAV